MVAGYNPFAQRMMPGVGSGAPQYNPNSAQAYNPNTAIQQQLAAIKQKMAIAGRKQVGSTIGSAFGPLGAAVGGMLGGMIGNNSAKAHEIARNANRGYQSQYGINNANPFADQLQALVGGNFEAGGKTSAQSGDWMGGSVNNTVNAMNGYATLANGKKVPLGPDGAPLIPQGAISPLLKGRALENAKAGLAVQSIYKPQDVLNQYNQWQATNNLGGYQMPGQGPAPTSPFAAMASMAAPQAQPMQQPAQRPVAMPPSMMPAAAPMGMGNPFEALRNRYRSGTGGYSSPNYTPGALASPSSGI